jgi:1,4-alpha-glucan branching enzyme
LNKMPGDEWQKFANLRLLLTYQYTRPGKQLVFMGTELAPQNEWNHDASLDWHLADDPIRAGLARYLADLGALYRRSPALWRGDPDPAGFAWIDCTDTANCVVSYVRYVGDENLVIILNFTPVPRVVTRCSWRATNSIMVAAASRSIERSRPRVCPSTATRSRCGCDCRHSAL